MAMDAVGKGEGGNESDGSIQSEEHDLIDEIQDVIESVARFGDYGRTQRKDCHNLVWRMKLLLPLIEEIRDLGVPMTEKGRAWLQNLKDALVLGKKVLQLCNAGSKIQLALGSEMTMVKFRNVYNKLSLAFDGLPFEELGTSDEVKEQLELMCVQLKRAKRRTDTQDMELAMDMMIVLDKKDDRNSDIAIIERLATKLGLSTVEDLNTETVAVRNLVKERKGQNAESTKQIIDLLNKCKRIAGIEETNVNDDPVAPRTHEKCRSLIIPHEFLCPITLEIMSDPVIIESGQTYERESILKWFESNHKTCPKTGQTLGHLSLAPNFALNNLIVEWCRKNKYRLHKMDSSRGEDSSSEEEDIRTLVENLSSIHLETQRKAVMKIRMMSKENSGNRVLVAQQGGIPPLVCLLSYPDSKIQEHTVTALLNLSIDEANKKLISDEGAIPAIIEVLEHGCAAARENSAAALFSLSMLDENKEIVGLSNGIPPLVDLLREGTVRGKKDAVTALFNLSLNHANKGRAIAAGIIAPLLQLLENKNLGMVDEALSILLLLASHPDGRHEIGQLSFIETLVEFMSDGTPKNKECAASALLELCSNNSSFILVALQYGVYEPLVEIKESGTNRAQRKANALLQLISKSEQI